MNVIITTLVLKLCCNSPSIFSSMVFCVKGYIFFIINQLSKRSTITIGNINIIHSPKPMPRFSPSGSLRYLRAIVFGGVPIGVPMPPRFAATGMLRAMAMRPLPSGGNCLNTGARKVSIMAAVAVLETNIENKPVMSRKPRSTFSLLLPNGRSNTFARWASIPVLPAAMARMNPPMKSMITGSAKVAITDL